MLIIDYSQGCMCLFKLCTFNKIFHYWNIFHPLLYSLLQYPHSVSFHFATHKSTKGLKDHYFSLKKRHSQPNSIEKGCQYTSQCLLLSRLFFFALSLPPETVSHSVLSVTNSIFMKYGGYGYPTPPRVPRYNL